MATYPYIEPQKGVFKPWVGVRLGYKKTHKVTPTPHVALIDSGADVNFCLYNIALWLGIKKLDPKNKHTFTAANNATFSAYKYMLDLYFNNDKYACPFYVTQTLPPSTPIILGQLGFFDKFRITFDLPEKKIEILNIQKLSN